MSLIAHHQILSSGATNIARLTLDTSAYSYTGELMIELDQDHLGSQIVNSLKPDDGSLRVYASESDATNQTNPLPLHRRVCKPAWFTNYFSHGVSSASGTPAWYDPTENVTAVFGLRGGAHEGAVIVYDHGTDEWSDPITLGYGDVTNNHPLLDSHGMLSGIKHNGVWYACGLSHASAMKLFTAPTATGPWTQQADVDAGNHGTYPRFMQIAGDLVLVVRDDMDLAQRDQIYYLLSENWSTKHKIIEATALPAANPGETALDTRAYLSEMYKTGTNELLVAIHQHETYSGWEARVRHFVFKMNFTDDAGDGTGNVTGFTISKVDGTVLQTNAPPTWNDLNDGDVMVAGWTGDPATRTSNVEARKGPWRGKGALWADGSGNVHYVCRETLTGSTVDQSPYTAQIVHFIWDGVSWSATNATGIINGIDAEYPRISPALLDGANQVLHYTVANGIQRLSYDGAAWTDEQVTNLAPILSGYTCWDVPIPVATPDQSPAPLFKFVANQKPAGFGRNIEDVNAGTPLCAWSSKAAISWPYVRLAVRPTITAGQNTDLYLRWGDNGVTTAAATAGDGEYAVYADWKYWRWLDMQTNVLQRGYGDGSGTNGNGVIDKPHSTTDNKTFMPVAYENGVYAHYNKAPIVVRADGLDLKFNDSSVNQDEADGTTRTAVAWLFSDTDLSGAVLIREAWTTDPTDRDGYAMVSAGRTDGSAKFLRVFSKTSGFSTHTQDFGIPLNVEGAITDDHVVAATYSADDALYGVTNEGTASVAQTQSNGNVTNGILNVGGLHPANSGWAGVIGFVGYAEANSLADTITNNKLETQCKVLHRRRDASLVSSVSFL
jgi:hypothetical protein